MSELTESIVSKASDMARRRTPKDRIISKGKVLVHNQMKLGAVANKVVGVASAQIPVPVVGDLVNFISEQITSTIQTKRQQIRLERAKAQGDAYGEMKFKVKLAGDLLTEVDLARKKLTAEIKKYNSEKQQPNTCGKAWNMAYRLERAAYRQERLKALSIVLQELSEMVNREADSFARLLQPHLDAIAGELEFVLLHPSCGKKSGKLCFADSEKAISIEQVSLLAEAKPLDSENDFE